MFICWLHHWSCRRRRRHSSGLYSDKEGAGRVISDRLGIVGKQMNCMTSVEGVTFAVGGRPNRKAATNSRVKGMSGCQSGVERKVLGIFVGTCVSDLDWEWSRGGGYRGTLVFAARSPKTEVPPAPAMVPTTPVPHRVVTSPKQQTNNLTWIELVESQCPNCQGDGTRKQTHNQSPSYVVL